MYILKLLHRKKAHVKLQHMTYENVNKHFFANINLDKDWQLPYNVWNIEFNAVQTAFCDRQEL